MENWYYEGTHSSILWKDCSKVKYLNESSPENLIKVLSLMKLAIENCIELKKSLSDGLFIQFKTSWEDDRSEKVENIDNLNWDGCPTLEEVEIA